MKKWFVLFLLLVSSVFAQREISKFSTSEIGESNEFIRPEFGDQLKTVQPSMVKDGLFYLRQKFEDPFDYTQINYQIFQGIATDQSMNLVKFQVQGLSPEQVAKTKFYSSPDEDPTFDLETVYIDGNHVFVEFAEEIFYWKNGSAISLRASNEKPYTVSVTSTPGAAEVSINGKPRGVTPVSYKQSSKAEIVVDLSKSGYYPQQYVAMGNGKDLNLSANLVKASSLVDPSQDLAVQISQMSGGATQENIDGLKGEYKRARTKVENSYSTAKAHAESNFPSAPAKVSGETDKIYQERTQRFSQTKTQYLNKLDADKNKIIAQLDKDEARLAQVTVKSASAAYAAPVEEEPEEEAYAEPEEEKSIEEASDEIYTDSFDEYEGPAITDRFSSSDEYIKWTGYGLIGGGVAALVPAVLQYLNFQKAEDNLKSTQQNVAQRYSSGEINDAQKGYYEEVIIPSIESARDTYQSEALLWGGLGFVAIGTGVTLLVAF